MKHTKNSLSFLDSKADAPKNIIFNGFIALFSLLTIILFFVRERFSDYVFQEWLVNYSQGFVRRGLPGTLLLFLSENYDFEIFQVIRAISYLIFIIFAVLYLFKVKQAQKTLDAESLLILLFLPSLILLPINDINVIGRKDFLFFFCLLLNLYFVEKFLPTPKVITRSFEYGNQQEILFKPVTYYCYAILLVFNILGVITALTHEGIAFLNLPLNIVISYKVLSLVFSKKQTMWRLIVLYLPTLIATLLGVTFKGNEAIATGICQSWQIYRDTVPILQANCSEKLPHVLNFFTISIGKAISSNWQINVVKHSGQVFFLWLLVFSLNALFLSRVSYKILGYQLDKYQNSQQLHESVSRSMYLSYRFGWSYALIPLASSVILYITAFDWGRWIFIVSVSYVLCLLTPKLIYLEIIGYRFMKNNFMFPFLYSIYVKLGYTIGEKLSSHLFIKLYPLLFVWTLTAIKIPHIAIRSHSLLTGIFPRTIVNLFYLSKIF